MWLEQVRLFLLPFIQKYRLFGSAICFHKSLCLI